MSKSNLSEIFSEIFGNKLAAIISNKPWFNTRSFLKSSLDSNLDVKFLHIGSQLMMNDIPGIAIDNTDQKKESPFKINILNVGMPMFMWLSWLIKTPAFFVVFDLVPSAQKAGVFKHPIGRRRANSNDIIINHHISQSSVSFTSMGLCVSNNSEAFPGKNPV